MVIKLIPFMMDKETADNQAELVLEAMETLATSAAALENLKEGQTAALWTADGKSVDLAAVLTARYASAVKWLAAIDLQLREAAVNLSKAIDETDQLDADQKANYQTLLYNAIGTGSTNKPIAV